MKKEKNTLYDSSLIILGGKCPDWSDNKRHSFLDGCLCYMVNWDNELLPYHVTLIIIISSNYIVVAVLLLVLCKYNNAISIQIRWWINTRTNNKPAELFAESGLWWRSHFLLFTVISRLDQNLIMISYTSVEILQLVLQVSDSFHDQ